MAKSAPQKESLLQKKIVEYLNACGLGCFVWRVRNAPTYDPVAHVFRANNSLKGIPDIIGWTVDGIFIGIEVKMLGKNGEIAGRPSVEQKAFLQAAAKVSPYVGVAYSLEDAEAIVRNNKETHRRNLRTYQYLNHGERKAYESPEGERKKTYQPNKPTTSCAWLNLTDENERKKG